jgi:predicted short-subunit dehydrogenase-like oxidoreductase (DUF2520 family)
VSGKEIKRARKVETAKPTVSIVGAGSLASFLAVALHDAGFAVTEIIARDSPRSRSLARARALARKVGGREVLAKSATLDANLLWLCVPDREIGGVAAELAQLLKASKQNNVRFVFHSSGALLGSELDPLRKVGVSVASVHPLMTFVAGSRPLLCDVPFAIEGDETAAKFARQIVRKLGGESFVLPASRKAIYHAWATMASPLLIAFLVTMEEAARAAGLGREEARRKSLPIIRQTLENYSRLGPAKSFSGPFIRGDAETVRKHLALLTNFSRVRKVYIALTESALHGLPVKNRQAIGKLLRK